MKHAINAALISLLVLSGTSLSQENDSKATIDTVTSYYHSLAKIIQTSLAYPFTALNIGSFDLEDENVSKTLRYKKCIRVIRSYLSDAKRTAFKVQKYFKTENGKRTLYETALFFIVMTGGYKIWLQNQHTHHQLAELSRKIDLNKQKAAGIKRKISTLKTDIAQLNAGLAQTNRNSANVAREIRGVKRAVQELAVQVRAPNSAQVAALQVKDGAVSATKGLFMSLVMTAVRAGLV